MFFELRQYQLRPGKRDEWVKLMDEVIIPYGDTVIEPGDRLLILSTGAVIPQVEQAIMGKR